MQEELKKQWEFAKRDAEDFQFMMEGEKKKAKGAATTLNQLTIEKDALEAQLRAADMDKESLTDQLALAKANQANPVQESLLLDCLTYGSLGLVGREEGGGGASGHTRGSPEPSSGLREGSTGRPPMLIG